MILEGPYVEDDTGACVVLADNETVGIPDAATVEVLKRADGASADLVGTMRREEHDGEHVVYAKGTIGKMPWVVVFSSAVGLIGRRFDDSMVGEFPVVGAIPDTPAAEAWTPIPEWEQPGPRLRRSVRVPNEPHGLPTSARPNVALLVRAGDVTGAIKAVRAATYWPLHEARAYVEDMEEYQTYLSKHGEKRQQRDARVFSSDGPEPPDDIECLLFSGVYRGRHDVRFLKRSVDLQRRWVWVSAPTSDMTAMVGDCNWPPPQARGSFTEVLS